MKKSRKPPPPSAPPPEPSAPPPEPSAPPELEPSSELERPSQLPEPREPSLRQLPAEAELPQEGYDQHYDEHGQPYAHDDQAYAQHYDEHGQPYYDENGQPYYDENGHPYDPNAYAEHPDYATAPMEHMPGHMAPHPQAPMPYPGHPQLHSHPPGVPIPAPPPSVGGPYRLPTAPVEPPAFQGFPQAAPPRPIIGSAIAVYGVLLWSFVVAGQFATSWISGAPMSQGTAAFLVFVSTTAAWGFALQRSRNALPSATMARFVWRGIGIGAAAFGLFFFTVLLATIFGQATRGHDFLIAFVLVALALTAIIMGPRLTTPVRTPRTPRMRFAVISMWIVGTILTFVAGAELATNG